MIPRGYVQVCVCSQDTLGEGHSPVTPKPLSQPFNMSCCIDRLPDRLRLRLMLDLMGVADHTPVT